jgi:hypothetical protein
MIVTDMQHGFKAHTMKIVPVGYGLHLPLFSKQDQSAHKQERVKVLLEDFKYLHHIEQVAVFVSSVGCPAHLATDHRWHRGSMITGE